MSNDSRQAFDAWHLATFGKAAYEYSETASQYFQDPAWMAWQANEYRHASEREALVRKCLTIATDYEALCGESFEMKYGTEDIQEALLALLSDSGNQG